MWRHAIRSVRVLAVDLSGTLFFALLLALGVPVLVATGAGIAMAAATVLIGIARGREVGALQWLSLVLVVLSGVATFATNDPRFVMAKPSVIAAIVGVFMLKPGWLARYIPSEVEHLIPDVTWAFGFAWAGLMFLTAGLNLLIVLRFPQYWLAFLAVFPAASKLSLFALHFGTGVLLARRRRRRGQASFCPGAALQA
jgi:intracellular septation protein A